VLNHIVRSILRKTFRFLFALLTRLDVRGIENLPKEGGYILATNHLGALDAPLVFLLLNRDDVTALVAKKHYKNIFIRWLINAVNGIWLNREEADTRALRAARAHLKNGGVLGIAPEGTRSPAKALLMAKTGAAYLADATQATIVPVAVTGTERGLVRALTLRFPKITVQFGEPFTLPPIDRREREADLRRNTDEIMARIATLLPPGYRGAYSEHPRLKELLQSKPNSH
jgi:1-acyl-sn-glycerol-3-phosphate acyltransferase